MASRWFKVDGIIGVEYLGLCCAGMCLAGVSRGPDPQVEGKAGLKM